MSCTFNMFLDKGSESRRRDNFIALPPPSHKHVIYGELAFFPEEKCRQLYNHNIQSINPESISWVETSKTCNKCVSTAQIHVPTTSMYKMTDVIHVCSFVIQISVFPSSQEGHSAWQVRNKKSGFYFLGI